MPVPFTLALLKTELQTDPRSMGYATLITQGAIGGLEALINSLTSAGKGSVPHESIQGEAFLTLLDPAELDQALTIGQKQTVQIYTSADQVDIGSTAFQSWALSVFTAGNAPVSNAAIAGAGARTGSRAEVLWGTGTHVTGSQIQDALAS